MGQKLIYLNWLSSEWRRCGIDEGDCVLLHSSIKRTIFNANKIGISLTPDDVLDSFLTSLGRDGTLILPLFNFDFPRSRFFDLRLTPSQMGIITEAARMRDGVVRTGHPIYSFAVLGKHKGVFSGLDNLSGYGADSPFGLLTRLDGKIACLDLEDQNSMTFYHHVEEMLEVSYRYFKTFSGEYIEFDGSVFQKEYKLFVRDIEQTVLTHVNPAGELMWKNGIYTGDRPKVKSGLRTAPARLVYNFVEELINQGKAEGNLFMFGEGK